MEKGKDAILMTGATGQQGGAIARELLSRGHPVAAMTRNPAGEPAKSLEAAGARIIQGDLDDPTSLHRAVQGMWGIFAVQNTWEAGVAHEEVQGKRMAEIAQAAGARHYVYSSVAAAERQTGIPHFDNKWRVEEHVRAVGFPSFTILRPVFFMDNFLSPWYKPAIDDGKLTVSIRPEARLQMIAVADIGKYGALAFEDHDRLNGRAISIAGDEMTMPEVAKVLGAAAGKPVAFEPTPIEQVRQFSEDLAIMLEWFDSVGYDVDIAGNSQEYGIEPTTFATWAAAMDW